MTCNGKTYQSLGKLNTFGRGLFLLKTVIRQTLKLLDEFHAGFDQTKQNCKEDPYLSYWITFWEFFLMLQNLQLIAVQILFQK